MQRCGLQRSETAARPPFLPGVLGVWTTAKYGRQKPGSGTYTFSSRSGTVGTGGGAWKLLDNSLAQHRHWWPWIEMNESRSTVGGSKERKRAVGAIRTTM